MSIFKNYISFGDAVDIYHLARIKGLKFIITGFGIKPKGRTASKWNKYECSQSDFWVIPRVKTRWNVKCTGNQNTEYEDYVVEKYLKGKSGLKLLSVGCGNSSHEQTFSKHNCFESVEGIDISEKQIIKARNCAVEDDCPKVSYRLCDFESETLEANTYDVVLFHSSIHHFKNINQILLEKTLPILKSGGLIVMFDYTGPNKLQWTNEQLNVANKLLKKIPSERKKWYNSNVTKKRVYRPGLFRMWASDPSEAADSEQILNNLQESFEVLEEKKLGGNLIHPLLKGISHHFCDDSEDTNEILNDIFKLDDSFANRYGSDFTFGVYRKR
jgi:ubiquinone/menaquinone biosynthesis C-methylase UbiE